VHAERLIAPAPPSHDPIKTDLSVASTPMLSEQTSVEEHALTDITALASSSLQDELVALALLSPCSQHLGDFSSEQTARPQDSSEKRFVRDEPGSDYASRTAGETAPTLQPDEEASTLTLAPSDESAFACAQPEEPPRREDAPVCGVEDGHADDVHAERLIAPTSPLHDTIKTDLSVASTPMLSEQTSVEEHASNATDITVLASSSQQDELVALALLSPSSQHLGDFSSEQTARPQDSSEKRFARNEPGSDYASRTKGETAPTLEPDEDASTLTLAPSNESAA
jgi:hypothetical protein